MTDRTAAATGATCETCGGQVASQAQFCPGCGLPRTRVEGDALIGKVIGDRYLLKARLGEGGAGVIYLAEHITVKRRVAVKVLHHELSRDELAIERFRREATTVGEIQNEHIVDVLDFGRLGDGRLFLAMELLEGETLAAAIGRETRLPVAWCLDVLAQAGEGLMEAHARGYIHRDLRPSNIFLANRRGKQRFVKLLDFGLAKLVQRDGAAATTNLGMTFGDPCYMSPEQARGDAADLRTDVYTLGVVAYEMLTGAPPFVARTVAEVLRKQIDEAPVPPSRLRPDVPGWLDVLVLRALAKRPADRFGTVKRLIEAIREGQTSGKVLVHDAAPPPPRSGAASRPNSDDEAPAGESTRRLSSPSRRGLYVALGILGAGAAALIVVASLAIYRRDGAAAPSRAVVAVAREVPVSRPSALTPAPAPAPAPARVVRSAPVATRSDHSRTVEAKPARKRSVLPDKVADGPKEPYGAPAIAPRPVAPEPAAETPADTDVIVDEAEDGEDRAASAPSAAPVPAPAPAAASVPAPVMGRGQAEFFVKLGQRALRAGDHEAATEHFEKALAIDGSSSEALTGLGEVAMKEDRFADAAKRFGAALRQAPKSARLFVLLGNAHLGAGDREAAAAAFRRALEIAPDHEAAAAGLLEAADE